MASPRGDILACGSNASLGRLSAFPMVGFAAAAFGAFTLGVLTSTSARGFLEKGGPLASVQRLQQLVENLSAPAARRAN